MTIYKLFQRTSVTEAVTQKDYEGETPIHHAAAIGNIEVYQIIVTSFWEALT